MRKVYFLLSVLFLTTLFTSCKDDEKEGLSISPKDMNLVAGQSGTIKVNGGTSGNQFTSGNEYIATVTNDGVVEAIRVGETEITVRDKNNASAKCKVKVTGKSKMYTEPYLQFGASKSKVKSFEKRTLLNEDTDALSYYGENNYVSTVIYMFKNNKLESSGVFLPYTKSNANMLAEFLQERYIVFTDGESNIYFTSIDGKTGGEITAQVINYNAYYLVVYIPLDYKEGRSNAMDINQIKEKANRIKNGIKF